jgi:hypothetical protein
VDVQIHVFLTSPLILVKWSASRPSRFIPGQGSPCTHWIRGWMGPKNSLGGIANWNFLTLPELELRCLGHPASSQPLYLLYYIYLLYCISRHVRNNYQCVLSFHDLLYYMFRPWSVAIFKWYHNNTVYLKDSYYIYQRIRWVNITLKRQKPCSK